MNRRSRGLAAAAIGLIALLVVAATAGAKDRAERPNVIVVMADDQDFRSLSAMPQTRKLIARQGTRFEQAIVNFPLCCPSRATFLSGQYAHNHGVIWNNAPLGGYSKLDGTQTVPVWLQRAGYRTIHIGKYLNEYGEADPLEIPPGWSDWHGGVDPSTYDYYGYTLNNNGKLRTYGRTPSDYSTDVYGALAERAIHTAAGKDKPFFLSLAPNAPHTVAVETRARVEGTPALPAPRHADVYADAFLPRYPNFDEADLSDKPTTLSDFFPDPFTADEIDALTDHYRGRMGSLLAVDEMVAGLVEELRQTGEYEDTVIVYTSDNGWILGEHRLRDPVTQDGRAAGVKYVPYEGSSRVPLMIAGPGFPEGRRVRGVTSNADLAPTILDLADARREATLPLDGVSLLRAARDPDRLDGRVALIETFENPRGVPSYTAIRTKRYRYDLQEDGQDGLYDLKLDPWELESVHDDPRYAAIKAALQEALARLTTCAGTSCKVPIEPLPPPGP